MRGKFIVFEGGEGAGKDTQIDLLKATVLGDQFVFTREPGGTPLGAKVRSILLDTTEEVSVEAEAFLFLADRAQHAATRIVPALESGTHVVSNRAFYSSIAYQVYGRVRFDLRPILDLAHEKIYAHSMPDLVVWLDLDPQVGLVRAAARGRMNRIDLASVETHERVRQGFAAQLEGKPNVLKIDATAPIEGIHHVILERIQKLTMI